MGIEYLGKSTNILIYHRRRRAGQDSKQLFVEALNSFL